jgi:hypothetical protein
MILLLPAAEQTGLTMTAIISFNIFLHGFVRQKLLIRDWKGVKKNISGTL